MKLLSLPYPFENNSRKKILNAFIGGIVVAVFLRVFSPFGFSQAPVSNLNVFAAGYGLITTIVILLFIGLENVFPSLFREEQWTIGKNILLYLLIIFVIGNANFFYTVLIARMPVLWKSYIGFQLFTLSVAFVVVSTMTMIKYFRSLNLNERQAEKLNSEVGLINHSPTEMIINFISDNEKENFSIPLENLLFIESADNYSKIIFRNDNTNKTVLLRTTLKRIEENNIYAELMRCHRAYIVQLRNVKRVSGNSQGYRLHFHNVDESIPVSRKMGKDVQERLQRLKLMQTA